MKYCVYITTYSGDMLPRNYIGSSSVTRVENGYVGSVSSNKYKDIWKHELRHNPQLFKATIVETFETRAQAIERELELQKEYDVVKSVDWINEGYAQPNGYAGRSVEGANNPMYGRGDKVREWAKANPDIVSKRNRKAAITQWSNPETAAKRIAAMQGKSKTFKDPIAYAALQREKALIKKEKHSIRIEYRGVVYVGWRELLEATGVSKHLYNKYYAKGIDPSDRIGKNGPAPH